MSQILGTMAFSRLTAKLGKPTLVDGEILIVRQVKLEEAVDKSKSELLVRFEVFDPAKHRLPPELEVKQKLLKGG